MAVTVVDSANQIPFMEAGKSKAPVETKVETSEAKVEDKVDKADEPQVDEYGLTEDDRKYLGAKFDKIIGKKHREKREAEEARDEAEAFAQNQYRERRAAETRAEELERQLQSTKPVEHKAEDLEPQETDEKYKDNPKSYWQDWAKWSARQELRVEREREAQTKAASELEARKQAFGERVAAAAKDIPDFYEVTSKAEATVPPYIAQYIEESDLGPLLGYHFSKFPAVLEALKKLSPIKAIAAVGKLEATLSAPAEKSQEKTEPKIETKPADKTRAPEPISPLNGGTGTVHKDLSEMTTRETIEYWQERDKAKATRRQRH